MSYAQKCPTLVYEVLPDRFDPASAKPPLQAIRERLDHLVRLGVDGLNLLPIFPASDPMRLHIADFFRIDPALGSEEDLMALCQAANEKGISVVMTGVFDHVSDQHEWFQSAKEYDEEEESKFPPHLRTRRYFTFGSEFKYGYACRDAQANQPELNLKNLDVRRRLFTGEESVLHHWLHLGVNAWRILRADAVGYSILRESSRASLTVEGEHDVIGDIKGFADRYVKDGLLDGVVNHYLREAIVSYLSGQIPARQIARVLRDLAQRYGSALNRSWNLISGHDTPRLNQKLGDPGRSRLALLLSYTLPGCAHLLYGEEIGLAHLSTQPMPAMDWNRANWDASRLELCTRLGLLRRARALRRGDFVDLTPEGEEEILAFARVTNDPRETVLVAANRASQTRVRKLFAPVCDLPDGLKLRDALGGPGATVRAGSVTLDIEGQSARILVPDEGDPAGARFFRDY